MNLKEEILKLIMKKTYSRKQYAEELTDEIMNLIIKWKEVEEKI